MSDYFGITFHGTPKKNQKNFSDAFGTVNSSSFFFWCRRQGQKNSPLFATIRHHSSFQKNPNSQSFATVRKNSHCERPGNAKYTQLVLYREKWYSLLQPKNKQPGGCIQVATPEPHTRFREPCKQLWQSCQKVPKFIPKIFQILEKKFQKILNFFFKKMIQNFNYLQKCGKNLPLAYAENE